LKVKERVIKNNVSSISIMKYSRCIGLILCLYVSLYWIEVKERVNTSIITRSLEVDGFCCMFNPEYIKTQNTPCVNLQRDILHKLPCGYVFIDYIYKIENTSLSTFHRDVTSSKKIYKTQYPVYTAILYKYDGDFLSVCPASNTTYPFVISTIVNISGSSGSVFLFDCELLHAGMINQCKKREVIQYKLCHKDDLHLLSHLQNTRAYKTDTCITQDISRSMIRKMSYYFQLPVNTFLYPLMIKKEENDTILGKIQSFIPLQYYNNV
jgi:uncharacterized cysteine cluster protein YcgN (CxxCxxCC family)